MAGFFNALTASLVLLMLMAVGYFMGVKGWMTAREKKFISKYIINIAVPCNCLSGMMNNLSHEQLASAGIMLISAVLSVGATLLLSMALASLLRLPRERWGVFVLMAGLSNTLYIGIPVSTQLFGDACLPYVMTYYLGNTVFLQSFGFVIMERAGSREASRITVGRVLKSLLSKPPILMVMFCIAMLLLDLHLPSPIMKFSGYVSNSVTPLALFYCGFIIYELGLKNIRLMRGLPLMLIVRLAVAPVICLVFCRFFGITGLAQGVFIVESALPVVSQVTVMAGDYGADERYAATGACLSTLASFITIPILMVLYG